MTRIVFLGTPDAAVPALAALTREFDVGLVITQPDRPKGRSGTPTAPPVKMFALDAKLKVAQPSTSAELVSVVEVAEEFDVGVVATVEYLILVSWPCRCLGFSIFTSHFCPAGAARRRFNVPSWPETR